MNREDIMQMAREAWLMDKHDCSDDWFVRADIDEKNIFEFAALVAAEKEQQMIREGYRQCAEGQRTTQFCGLLDAAVKAEREACAKLCDHVPGLSIDGAKRAAAAIRARGEP